MQIKKYHFRIDNNKYILYSYVGKHQQDVGIIPKKATYSYYSSDIFRPDSKVDVVNGKLFRFYYYHDGNLCDVDIIDK